MAKPKPLSDILINLEKIKIRKIINKLYYGKGRMTFEEAEAQFNEINQLHLQMARSCLHLTRSRYGMGTQRAFLPQFCPTRRTYYNCE